MPSAVWIDEEGFVRRIDEGTYATTHRMGDFEFGREDYAPMVTDWVERGDASPYVGAESNFAVAPKSEEAAKAAPAFRLGVHFKKQGDEDRAGKYWQVAQQLNPDSWNYHRQDWSYTPEEAGENWQKKVQSLEGRPYYKPISELEGSGSSN